MTWWDRWVWPAGGSGGVPGDIVATLIWVILAAIITVIALADGKRVANLPNEMSSISAGCADATDQAIAFLVITANSRSRSAAVIIFESHTPAM